MWIVQRILFGLFLVLISIDPVWSQGSLTKLITLGTGGGPLPRGDRAQSSNLLLVNGQPYLIDMGDGVTRRLAESGTSFLKVNQILLLICIMIIWQVLLPSWILVGNTLNEPRSMFMAQLEHNLLLRGRFNI